MSRPARPEAGATHSHERLALQRPPVTVFFGSNTMRSTKFAISMPQETMKQVDRAAKRLGMTRSRYIAVILAQVARREHDLAISRRVDEVLDELDQEDGATALHLLAARRDEGTEW